jgi:hypothetical protein
MGELKPDTIVTMHVIVRPVGAGKPQGDTSIPAFQHALSATPTADKHAVLCVRAATSKEKERQQGCVCCIQ